MDNKKMFQVFTRSTTSSRGGSFEEGPSRAQGMRGVLWVIGGAIGDVPGVFLEHSKHFEEPRMYLVNEGPF